MLAKHWTISRPSETTRCNNDVLMLAQRNIKTALLQRVVYAGVFLRSGNPPGIGLRLPQCWANVADH